MSNGGINYGAAAVYYEARLRASNDVDAEFIRWMTGVLSAHRRVSTDGVIADVLALTDAYKAVKGV